MDSEWWASLDGELRKRLADGGEAGLGPLRAEHVGGLSGIDWGPFVVGGAAIALGGLVAFGYGVAVGDGLDMYVFGPVLLVIGVALTLRPVLRPRRWWAGAFELGLVGVHDRQEPVAYRWADLVQATYLRIEKYYNLQHTETQHRLKVWPTSGKIMSFHRNDSVVNPPAVRLGDFAAVIISQLAAQAATWIVADVSEGRTARRSEPIDVVIAPEGLTWGSRTYPWEIIGGLHGYTADTWNKGRVDLLRADGGPPFGAFNLGKGMSSEKIGVCMALDTLARSAR